MRATRALKNIVEKSGITLDYTVVMFENVIFPLKERWVDQHEVDAVCVSGPVQRRYRNSRVCWFDFPLISFCSPQSIFHEIEIFSFFNFQIVIHFIFIFFLLLLLYAQIIKNIYDFSFLLTTAASTPSTALLFRYWAALSRESGVDLKINQFISRFFYEYFFSTLFDAFASPKCMYTFFYKPSRDC